jgi:hypothetical protein
MLHCMRLQSEPRRRAVAAQQPPLIMLPTAQLPLLLVLLMLLLLPVPVAVAVPVPVQWKGRHAVPNPQRSG